MPNPSKNKTAEEHAPADKNGVIPVVGACRILLNRVYPGALAAASGSDGSRRVHLEHWPSNPLVRGSYTCNHPGYFTTIADNEAKPVDNLHFAGEHTSSFYEFQGFMEGAVLSGIRAAREILRDIKIGAVE